MNTNWDSFPERIKADNLVKHKLAIARECITGKIDTQKFPVTFTVESTSKYSNDMARQIQTELKTLGFEVVISDDYDDGVVVGVKLTISV